MDIEQFTNSTLAILVIIIIAINLMIALTINGDIFQKRINSDTNSTIQSDYFDVLDPWGSVSYQNVPNSLGVDTSECNWFTYENVLGINKNPNIVSGISDFEQGFSHLSPPQTCIDQDQLVFRTGTRICDGVGSADCIGIQGERINRDATNNFNSACVIPSCTSTLGSLSFNFFQQDDNSPIDSGTRFMTFSKIFVNEKVLASITADPTKQFYVNEGGLFQFDDAFDLKDNQYYPLIRYLGKQDGNFKQNISLERYSYDGEYTQDDNGPYGEFLFRPQQLYLDIEINETSGQIDNFELVNTSSSYLIPLQDQYLQVDKIRKIYNGSTFTGDTCTAVIVGSGNTYSANINIYRRGTTTYTSQQTLNIENDDEDGNPLQIKITSLVDFSIFPVLSPSPKKWLLIPPLDIGGGQEIPIVDRTSFMETMNQPLPQEWIELVINNYAPPPHPASDGDFQTCFTGPGVPTNSLAVFGQNLYGGGNNPFGLTVKQKTKCTFRTFTENEFSDPDRDQNANGAPGFGFWWNIAETDQKIDFGGNKEAKTGKTLITDARWVGVDGLGLGTISQPKFPDNYIENFLTATSKATAKVDATTSDFFTLYGYAGSKSGDPFCDPSIGAFSGRCGYDKCTISYRVKYPTKPPNILNKDYKDGNVTWQIVNAREKIFVYSSQYFKNTDNQGSPATNFSLVSGGSIYKQPSFGVVQDIDFSSFNSETGTLDKDGTYTNISITGSQSSKSSCKATVVIKNGTISGMTVTDPGSGYIDGEECSMTVEQVDVSNMYLEVLDTNYAYVAFPTDIQGNPIVNVNSPGIQTVISSYGLILDPNKIKIVSGKLTLVGQAQKIIVDGGFGYSLAQQIYIDQLDINGISVLENATTQNTANISITGINNQNINIKVPNLMSTDLDDIIPDDFFTYNFYEVDTNQDPDTLSTYTKSPQQIGYILPSDEQNMNSIITTGGEEQFKAYLFDGSPGGISSATKLTTLQFRKLNYNKFVRNPPGVKNNIISSNENLVLGKFIPYTQFSTAKNKSNKAYPYDLFNGNNVRLIPNSLTSIYSRSFSSEDKIPTF